MNFYFWVAEIRNGDRVSGVIYAKSPSAAHAEVTETVNKNSWHKYTVIKLERIE